MVLGEVLILRVAFSGLVLGFFWFWWGPADFFEVEDGVAELAIE